MICLLGYNDDPREVWEFHDARRYLRWWARYAGMNDPATADHWFGASSAVGRTCSSPGRRHGLPRRLRRLRRGAAAGGVARPSADGAAMTGIRHIRTPWPLIVSACADCGIGTIRLGEWYMVNDDVWERAWRGRRKWWHRLPGQEVLCIGCLERRLGRTLVACDFIPGIPCNDANQRGYRRACAIA